MLVIAEAGVNHDGDVDDAHRLVDAAAAAGADCVKFQTFEVAGLVASRAAAAPYQAQQGATDQRSMLEALALPRGAWPELAAHADELGLRFASTAFDERSLELLLDLGVSLVKAPSGEVDNLGYLRRLAGTGLPLLLSTGMADLGEVARALDAVQEAPSVTVLHCVSAYPAPLEECNLRAMVTMRDALGVQVGWSDHTLGSTSAVVAVALGAVVLEKHLTLDRRRPGPDHEASADPEDFQAYVTAVRGASACLGDGEKRPSAVELVNREHVRRSWHAVRSLQAGHQLSPGDVELLRPATGVPAGESVLGRTLVQAVAAGDPVPATALG